MTEKLKRLCVLSVVVFAILVVSILPDAAGDESKEKKYPAPVSPATRAGREAVMTTLYSMHLKEAVPVWFDKRPPKEYLEEIFRCRGFAFKRSVDIRLVDVVLGAAKHFKSSRVVIVSAYRSPKFNDALSKKARNVVSESRHTKGEAIDFYLDDVSAKELGSWIWNNFEGGLGVYVTDNFVHIDVGPKRRWWGS